MFLILYDFTVYRMSQQHRRISSLPVAVKIRHIFVDVKYAANHPDSFVVQEASP
jgi:hypothetical protein